jgi:hypothetical protein
MRFLSAIAMLLAVVAMPALWRAAPPAAEAVVVVSVSPAPAREFDGAALARVSELIALGRRTQLLESDPECATRLLRAVAAGRLRGRHSEAASVLIGLGDATRVAARRMLNDGAATEREVARAALMVLDGKAGNDLAAWTARPRTEW